MDAGQAVAAPFEGGSGWFEAVCRQLSEGVEILLAVGRGVAR